LKTQLPIIPLTMVILGTVGGFLSDKFGGAKITVIGVTLLLISQFLIMGFNLQTPYWFFIFASIVTGMGTG
ncbi:hypothetical protein LLP44_20425, partial [Terrisporobacter mayombei]|nr:hypothetical protein [Terrisporobacter mayombei]